jgi:hypothetical protein
VIPVETVPDALGQLAQGAPAHQVAEDLSGRLAEGILTGLQARAGDVLVQAVLTFCQVVIEGLRHLLRILLEDSLDVVSHTSPSVSYANGTVRELWGTSRTIANAALAVVALWGGINLITRPHLGTPHHAAMEFLPRLVVGGLLANTSLWWSTWAIDLNNALCRVFIQHQVAEAFGPLSLPSLGLTQVTDALAAVAYYVAWCLLYLQMLTRIALVDLLLVVSPLAMLLWVLPQTEGWSRLWSSTFATSVFTQFVQVATLELGRALIAEAPFAALRPDGFAANVLVGSAVVILTFKVPRLLRSQLGGGASVFRYFVARRMVEALSTTPAGRGAAGAAAAAGATGRGPLARAPR